MFRFNRFLSIVFVFLISYSNFLFSQCNIEASVCQPGVSTSFSFIPTTGPYAGGSFAPGTCSTGSFGNHSYAFITLKISNTGPLNLLINGNLNTGWIDVILFNIPPGIDPCQAITNPANEIGCNFASESGGCVQFGNVFNCGSNLPAINVVAGQEIMIVAQSWDVTGSTSFTLEFGAFPSAQPGAPSAAIDPVSPMCSEDSPIQMTAANMGGLWTGRGITPDGIFDPVEAGVGSHTISYSIGVDPCSDFDQTLVIVNPAPSIGITASGISPTGENCPGDLISLQATGLASVNWSSGIGNSPNVVVSPDITTTYSVSGVSSEGCVATESITLVITPLSIDVSPNQTICENGSTTISANGVGGNSFVYHWGHTADTNPIQEVNPSSPTVYSVYVENSTGCSSPTRTIFVDFYAPIQATIDSELTVCPGASATLTITDVSGGTGGPYMYAWLDALGNVVGNSASFSTTVFNNSTYTVLVSDECQGSPVQLQSSFVLAEIPELLFSVNEPNQCQDNLFEFGNLTDLSNVNQFNWRFGNELSFSNEAFVSFSEEELGKYFAELSILTNDGCVETLRIDDFFVVHENPIAKFNWAPFSPTVSNSTTTFFNESYLGESCKWTFEKGSPSLSFETTPTVNFQTLDPGYLLVTLTVFSEFGCKDSIADLIDIKPDFVLYAPNTFTPDGNNINDEWRIYIDGVMMSGFTLYVFDRWGQRVWESHDAEASWNGKFGGNVVNEGVYVWTLEATDAISDYRYSYKGHLNILR